MRSGLRAMGVLRPEGKPSDEPVALETAVIATGARPGDVGSKRELFTEETQTVLVFEKGAVIRLSAGVADGQLLFLTNKKTGKEVVTQVVRKRSFRPTSCYVDLEFTEASPGFWGIEFPKLAPVLPSQVANDSSDDEGGDSVKHAVPPDQLEVERLKKEVAELQTQLKSLTGSPAGTDAADPPPGAVPSESSTSEPARPQHEEKVLAQLLAQEAQQEQLHGPKRLVAYPKKGTGSIVKAASKVATAGAVAAVVVAGAIAAYRFGLFDSFIAKSTAAKPAPSQASANVSSVGASTPKTLSTAQTPASPSVAAPHTSPDAPSVAAQSFVGNAGTETASIPSSVNSKRADAVPVSTAADTMPKDAKRRHAPVTNGLVGASPSSPGSVSSSGSAATVMESSGATAPDYAAPKLIYSVKPVSPPEALRNYVTGNVNVEAVVDVTGHVKSVTVISGPEKLHNTAIREMKQYVYEPARKNGKPVIAHVQASLKYWYEP
jgi:hypothetical protein